MDKKDFVKRLYAGLFFIIGILAILVVIFAIGIEKGLTQPKFQITALFKEVGGLSVGAPIRLSGVNVGTVASIDFLDEKVDGHGVIVVMNAFRRYRKQLDKSTSFVIKTEGILGQKLIEISSDEKKDSLDLMQPVAGQDPLDVQDIAESFGDTARSLTETSKAINAIIKELQYISKTSKRVLNRIEQRLIEGNLFSVF